MRAPRSDRRRPRQPIFVLLMAMTALAMVVPGLNAQVTGDRAAMEVFLTSALLVGLTTGILGLALRGRVPDEGAPAQLMALLGAFTVLPLLMALPLWRLAPGASYFDAWFEMVSAFTTTGATLWDDPEDLSRPVHLWRAIVGWLGGLVLWLAAMAILAPLSLGGFEVRASLGRGRSAAGFSQVTRTAGPYERLDRFAAQLIPVYGGLTLVLALLLILSGQTPFVAICHAMSVMATSGISPVGGLAAGGGTLLAEVAVLGFLVFALTRLSYGLALPGESGSRFADDPELRMGLVVVAGTAAVLFLRHWFGGVDGTSAAAALQALWGDVFTAASYLVTLGFESRYWDSAMAWSGLGTPGLVLLGLAIFGGGIGTTAGGVKLLRVHALYKHGLREMERLVHPSSVGGAGPEARHIRRTGASIAWIFFMLFALSIAAFMLALSLAGLDFEQALVLTVAALTNCGPLAASGGAAPISYAGIGDGARAVLMVAMVVGRVELLAIIALLNPEAWRR
ncbi:TrkH family potassium uptake protein [Histidinibacterium lentulum]|uniref:TrkH family potassium uptake protein n=1 Tax=Histidinibacterium lentulum TaxID=2480588 RepID=A0A3N2R9L1_9RHOB|nr:potassium transporter TrkG [Histidinibacterium lentulum]ROU04169.1 TrkH family potassium uptake protein [Histidinibacterium lentulum]